DGRNARLTYTAPAAGQYLVHVLSASGAGEYTLYGSGWTGASPSFSVTAATPANQSNLTRAPSQMTVTFSAAVLLDTLEAGDLTINGIPAVNVTALSPTVAVFDLPAGLPSGTYDAVIAAGSVLSLPGAPLQAFTSRFRLDLEAPRVIACSLLAGDVLSPGNLTLTVQFSEPLNAASLTTAAAFLTGLATGSFDPTTWSYAASTSTLTIGYSLLPEDSYTLILQAGRVSDPFGNALDGETPAWPIGPYVSGNGVPGGDFVLPFSLDPGAMSTLPIPVKATGIPGAGVYYSKTSASIGSSADSDTFGIDLDAGQALTVVVHSFATLVPSVSVRALDGTVLGQAQAPAAGLDALVQSIRVAARTSLDVVVTGAAGSTGGYDITIYLNAADEAERRYGPANNSQASAQPLDDAFGSLAGGGTLASVVGTLPGPRGPVIAAEDFSWVSGGATRPLPAHWAGYSSGTGIARVTSDSYSSRLALGVNSGTGGYSEAVWSVNLSGVDGATLSFNYVPNYDYEPGVFPASFTGGVLADGIAISADGVTWYPIWQPVEYQKDRGTSATVDLGAAAAKAGIPLDAGFRIKFQDYGDGVNDREAYFKSLSISGHADLTTNPAEDFESPGLSPAWTTWQDNAMGQIHVSSLYGASHGSQALVLETGPTDTPVAMEATWAIDLTGYTKAQLRFDYQNYYTVVYESRIGAFTGHRSQTGVAISADGTNWYMAWSGTGDYGAPSATYVVDLAAAAKTAGIPLGQPLLVRFQAYVGTPGWTQYSHRIIFDDIRIEDGLDWYSLPLAAGQEATVALKADTAGVDIDLALYDQAGQQLTRGVPITVGADERIVDFTAPGDGRYYLRISGTTFTSYHLAVTRGAQLEFEPTGNDNLDSPANAQDISRTGVAAGFMDIRADKLYVYATTPTRGYHELDPLTGQVLRIIPDTYSSTSAMGLAATRNSLLVFGQHSREIDLTGSLMREIQTWTDGTGAGFSNNEIFAFITGTNNVITVYDYATGTKR
ncbi:MAG: Ig-like domain-containing protein, partial [Planctomycetota bacterium]|nr:Ig-like domain-containing protein [Planctomycetota bacterium]